MNRSPVVWGTLATTIYCIGLFSLLKWLGRFPDDGLTWNEIGDFFAGAFAPLAFVWLVVAVFLQRSELEAQRKTLEQQMGELKLSREELRLNREMLKEQAEELRLQSSALERQVKALDEDASIEQINAHLEDVLKRLRLKLADYRIRRGNDLRTIYYYEQTNTLFEHLEADRFAEACQEAVKQADKILQSTVVFLGDVGNILIELKEIEKSVKDSDRLRRTFVNYPIAELISKLTEIEKLKPVED